MITDYDTRDYRVVAAEKRAGIVSASLIVKWAAIECDRSSGGPRAYTGPYPDLSGPTMAHAPMVADVADAMTSKLRAVT